MAMTINISVLIPTSIFMVCCGLGCQSNNQHTSQLAHYNADTKIKPVMLASHRLQPPAIPESQQKEATAPDNQNDDKQQVQTNKQDPPAKTTEDTEVTPSVLYTAPSSASALAIATTAMGAVQNMTNDGQEAAENISLSITNFRRGLAPSISIGDSGRIGKRGLQRGSPLTGANNLNIFTPRSNGITNRCQELITAGFFADVTGCRNHFSR